MKSNQFKIGDITKSGGVIIDGPQNKDGANLWLFRCKCGKESWKTSSRINSTIHGCRDCFFESKKLQYYIGKVFDNGYVIIDGPIKKTNSTSKTENWKIQCTYCNKVLWRQASNITRSSCQTCWGISKRKRDDSPKLHKAFNSLKGNAKRRGLSVEITFEEFVYFSKKDCEYCGAAPQNRRGEKEWHIAKINGIDRIDNSEGYTTNNVASCCWQCNQSKRDLSLEDWRYWIKMVSEKMLNENN